MLKIRRRRIDSPAKAVASLIVQAPATRSRPDA
jgi:hypothetical protein